MTPASSVLLFVLALVAGAHRDAPQTPAAPSTPSTPATPKSPQSPAQPQTPATPQQPTTPASPQTPQTPVAPANPTYEPSIGQPGKDVVWVPTSPELVEKMLDMAQVTKDDLVMDLGSGDGRNIIAAAKRGARGIGVEFNPDMVALSRRTAEQAGLGDRATFVEADMFEADISKASVLALFLLTDNLRRLLPKFLDMRPGSRIVVNTFTIPDWEPDAKETLGGECMSWCTALLWIVPAKVEGTWRMSSGELVLKQKFQIVSGTLTANGQQHPIENGRLRGEELSFTANGVGYTGQVNGNVIEGQTATGAWRASRTASGAAPASGK
jgi:precorrin-6B methylase 2